MSAEPYDSRPETEKPIYPMLAAQMVLLLEEAKKFYDGLKDSYAAGGKMREGMEDWLRRCNKLFERLEEL